MALENLHKIDWMEQAACKGVDTNIFFQDQGASYKRAKAICIRCDVQIQCLDYVMRNGGTHDDEFGLWGGKTPMERRKMKKLLRVHR